MALWPVLSTLTAYVVMARLLLSCYLRPRFSLGTGWREAMNPATTAANVIDPQHDNFAPRKRAGKRVLAASVTLHSPKIAVITALFDVGIQIARCEHFTMNFPVTLFGKPDSIDIELSLECIRAFSSVSISSERQKGGRFSRYQALLPDRAWLQ